MDDFYRDLGAGLSQGGARLRRRRLPLSAARRGQPRLSVRPGAARADPRARRRSGGAAGDLCRHDQRGDFRYSGRHDHHHASVPRQFPLDLRRQGGYEPVAEMLFNSINVHGYFMEYDTDRAGGFEPLRFVPKGKTVVLGPRHLEDRARSKARTKSSAASTKRRNIVRSTSFASRRNAALPRPRKATCWPRMSNGRSCA